MTTSFPVSTDDARGTHIRSIARSVQAQGWRVSVLAPGSPSVPALAEVDGVLVRRHTYWFRERQRLASGLAGIIPNLQSRPTLAVQIPGLVLSQWMAIMRFAPGHDLIHAHWLIPSGFAALRARNSLGIPIVVTAHGGDVNRAKPGTVYGRLVCRVASRADICTVVSEGLAERLVSIGVPRRKIEPTPLGVDPPPTEPDWPPVDAGLRFLYAGSLIERKSVATLVEAFARLRRGGRDSTLHLVGDGPLRMELEQLARRLGVDVEFMGARGHEETLRCMASCHVLVLPSRSEGRPVVVLEAMAHSRPVIASDIAGTNELVRHGITGLTFAVGDPDSLAAQLAFSVDHPERMRGMGATARRELEHLGLTAEISAGRLVGLYERALSDIEVDGGG